MAVKAKIVSPTTLAAHLGVSRQYVEKLAADGVIERGPTGFDQDQSRLKYISWLRDPRRRSARAEAEAELRQLKMTALRLMEHAEHIEILDDLVGLVRTELAALPARLTRDLQERRRIERAVDEILHRMADRAEEMARAC
jgi:hypothetical protein